MGIATKMAYLAGLVDGEGCFCVIAQRGGRHGQDILRYYLRIDVTNRNREALEFMRETFNAGVVYYEDRGNGSWRWASTRKRDNRCVIEGLLPYLIIKREQAKMALRFITENLTDEEKAACRERMSERNHIATELPV